MHCSYFRIGFDNTQAYLLPALCLIWKALSSKGAHGQSGKYCGKNNVANEKIEDVFMQLLWTY